MNILTFDIEEWFHLLDVDSTKSVSSWNVYPERIHRNLDLILDLLDRTNQKGTFFVLGWIAEKYPEIIKKIDSMGYEIGSHSHTHQLAYNQTHLEYKEDLHKSIGTIESCIGKKVTLYRAPGFSIKEENKWAFEYLIEEGILIDSSIFPAKRAHGGFNNFGFKKPGIIEYGGVDIKEFPINTISAFGNEIVFSGGGYFRLLPLPILKKLWANSNYTMTYFHPRDFDSSQPVIEELNLFRRFKSYYGLKSCLPKLENILHANKFYDIGSANKTIDWDKSPRVKL